MANVNFVFVFVLCTFVCLLVLREADTANCELKARINKAFKELPIVEELKKNTHRPLGNPANRKRSAPANKRPSRQTIPQLAKNIESFLQKVIPNHNLVQDLMGYITMPNPNSRSGYYQRRH